MTISIPGQSVPNVLADSIYHNFPRLLLVGKDPRVLNDKCVVYTSSCITDDFIDSDQVGLHQDKQTLNWQSRSFTIYSWSLFV